MPKGEGLYPAPTRKVQDLDARISSIQKGTKAAIPAMVPLHDILRQKFRWYYKWSTWPASKFINILILVIYLGGAGFFAYNFLSAPKKAVAATADYNYLSPVDIATAGSSATTAKATHGNAVADLTPSVPGTELTTGACPGQYCLVNANDANRFTNSTPGVAVPAKQMYRMRIGTGLNQYQITQLSFTHVGYRIGANSRQMYIWDFGGSSWEALGAVDTATADSTLTRTKAINQSNVTQYIDTANRYVYFKVATDNGVAAPKSLVTNFAQLTITYNTPPAAPVITSPNTAVSWPLNSSANPVTWTTTATNQVEAANLTQYDNFNDNSLDAALWTGGGTSNGITKAETGSEIKISGTASAQTYGDIVASVLGTSPPALVYQLKQKAAIAPSGTAYYGTYLMSGNGDASSRYLALYYQSSGWIFSYYNGTGWTTVSSPGHFGNETGEYKTLKIIYNPLTDKHSAFVYDADGTEHYMGTTAAVDMTVGGTKALYGRIRGYANTGEIIDGRFDDYMITPVNFGIDENFDSYTDPNNPTGWTIVNEPTYGSVEVDSAQKVGATGNSVLLQHSISNGELYTYKDFSPALDGIVYAEADVYTDIVGQPYRDIRWNESGGNIKAIVRLVSDGNMSAFNGVTATVIRTYTNNTWYHILVVIDTQKQTYDVYVDGVLEADDFAVYSTAGNKTISRALLVSGGNVTATLNTWFDNIQAYTEFKTIIGLSASGTSQTWNTLTANGWTAGTKYLARARTLASGLWSAWDYSDTTFTLYDIPATPSVSSPADAAPDIAINPTVTSSAFSGSGSHTVSDWEIYDNASLAAGNRVWYKADDAANLTSIVVNTTNGTFENALVGQTALANATQYWVRVRHANAAGDSAWSVSTHDFTTLAGTPPAAPTNVTVDTIAQTTATSHWTDNATDETGYKVWVSTASANPCSGATYNGGADYPPAADAISQALITLTPAKSYCVKVAATRSGTDSDPAFSSVFHALPATPNAPTVNATSSTSLTTIIDTTLNDSTATYALSCDLDTTFLNYTTNACEAIVDDANHWRTYTNWGGAGGFVDTGLAVNTSHTYKAKARNTKATPDESALSSGTSKFTLADTASAPTVNAVSTSSTSIAVTADTNPATTEYALSCDSDTTFLNYTTNACEAIADDANHWRTAVNWGTFTDTGYLANTNHIYKAKARNGNVTPDETVLSSLGQKYTLIETPVITIGVVTQTTIAMTGGTLSNIAVGSSGVWFEETSGLTGGGNLLGADGFAAFSTTNSITDNNLIASTTYSYKAKAKNGNGTETAFSTPDVNQITDAPAGVNAPTNVNLTTDSATQITVGWTDNSDNETGFKVYISTTPNADCSLATYPGTPDYTTAADAVSQAASGLSINSQYCAKVIATTGVVDSTPAYAVSPKYTLANSANAPTVNATSSTSLTIIIANTDSNPAATTYALSCDTDTTFLNFTTNACEAIVNDADHWRTYTNWGGAGGFVDTGFAVNTQHTYKVLSRNGDSVNAAISSGTPKYTLADTASAPTVNAVSTSSTSIAVTADTNPASTEYALSCDADATFLNYTTNACEAIADDANHWRTSVNWGTFTDTGYLANTNHTYKVISRNGDKTEQALSASASKYTLIEVPTGITFGAVDDTSIAISASGTLSNLATASSGLYFTQTSANPGGGGAGFLAWTQTNSLTDSGLTAATQYSYKVKARNGNGTETAETSIYNQTTTNTLAQPTAVTIGTITATGFTVTWNDNATGEASYKVYISTTANADCSLATYPGVADYTTAADAVSQPVTGKSVNTQYCAKVASYNGSSEGTPGYSSPKYTLANDPTAPTITNTPADNPTTKLNIAVNKNGNPEGGVPTTEILRPNATGDKSETEIGGSAPATTRWESVDEAAADDGVTNVWTPVIVSPDIDLYNVQTPSVMQSGDTINSVTVYMRSYAPTGVNRTVSAVIKENSVETVGTVNGVDNVYITFSQAWNTKPSNGTVWTYADIVNLQIGIKHLNSMPLYTTQVYVEINYTPATTSTQYAYGIDIAENGGLGDGSVDANGWVQAGNTFGASEAWQSYADWGSSTGEKNSPLNINSEYCYRAKAKNGDNTATALSGRGCKYTYANTPAAPTISNTPADSPTTKLNVLNNVNGNPANTEFAINETSTGLYAQASGALGASPVWQTDAVWGGASGKNTTGLSANTNYTFKIRVRNGDSVESPNPQFSSTASKYTYIQAVTNINFDTINDNSLTISATGSFSNLATASSGIYFKETSGNAGGGNLLGNSDFETRLINNSIIDNNLTIGTQYCYQSYAVNGEGVASSAYLPDPVACQVTSTTMALPSNVLITPTATSEVAVTWVDNAIGEDGYRFTFGTATGDSCAAATWGTPEILTASSTQRVQDTLSANSRYCAKVETQKNAVYSSPAYPAPKYSLIEPVAAVNFDATFTQTALTAGPTNTPANLNQGLSGIVYKVYRTSDDSLIQTSSVLQNANNWTSSVALDINIQYRFEGQSQNGDGIQTAAATSQKYTRVEPISAVSWNTGAFTTGSLTATPTNSPSNLAAGTSGIRYCNTTTADCSLWQQNTNQWASNGLNTNAQYQFSIQSRNGDGITETESTSSKYTRIEPVAAVGWGTFTTTSLSGSPTNNPTNLAIGSSGLQYKIYKTSDNSLIETSSWLQDTNTWAVSTLLDINTQYRTEIQSRNGDSLTETAATAQKYTRANVPGNAGHSMATADITLTSIKWTWGLNSNPGYTEFCVNNDASCGAVVEFVDNDPARTPNTQYSANLYAKNGDGIPTATELATGYTAIETPTTITAGLITPNSIALNMTDVLTGMNTGTSGIEFLETSGNPAGGGEACFSFCQAISTNDVGLKGATSGVVGTTYTYKAKARNFESVETPESGEFSFTTTAGIQLLFALPGETLDENGGDHLLSYSDPNPSTVTAGSAFDINIFAADGADYRDLAHQDTIALSSSDPAATFPASSSMTNGQISYSGIVMNTAGPQTITGLGSGGSSHQFTVIPGVASATNSTISANPASLSTGSTSTITVTLKDAFGNNLSGHSVTVSSNQVSDVFTNNSTATNSSGIATIYLSSGLAHTSTLTATDTTDSITLNSQPQVTFTSASTPTPTPTPTPIGIITVDNPANFTGTAGNQYTNLSWTNPASFDHINIYRSTGDGELGSLIADNIVSENYTDNNLTNGTTYYYTLKSSDSSGNLSSGTYQLGLTPTGATDNQAPTAPTNLRATNITSSEISLRWNASTDNVAVVGYRIYNAVTGIQIGATVETNITLTELSPETIYSFFVKAYDAAGNLSESSNTLQVTTLALAPGEKTPGDGYICRKGGGKVAYLVLSNVPAEISSGERFKKDVKVKAIAADRGGGFCEDYRGSIYFDSTDKKADLFWSKSNPYTFSQSDAGAHEFQGSDFKLVTVGNQELSITDNYATGKAEVKVLGGVVYQKAQDYIKKNSSKVNTAVITTTTALLLTSALVNLAIGLGNIIPQLLYWFSQLLQLIGVRKRRKPWGLVFNSQSGQPVSLAVVRIYDKEYNRLLETAATDREGRFGFLVKPGTFYIKVQKTGFTFPSMYKVSEFFENVYSGGNFEVKGQNESVAYNIPLDPQTKVSLTFSLLVILVKFNKLLQKIRVPLLIIGTIFALIMIITNYHILFVLSLVLYAFLGIFDLLRIKKARPYGIVTDVFGHPLQTAMVRIYEKKKNRMVATDVSDAQGRFRFLVNPGIYYITAVKPGYIDFKSHIMYLEKERTLVTTNVKLKKVENINPKH